MKYLFTYGTLMNNRCRNEYLHYCGFHYVKDVRIDGYTIHTYPRGDYPVILPGAASNHVIGELWEFPNVDESVLEHIISTLDTIEGVGYLYDRKEVKMDDGALAIAYVGIPETWNGIWLSKPEFDEYGKWVGGDYIA